MDENTAWRQFEKTGKIKDYINYSNIKTMAPQCIAGGVSQGVVNLRDLDASKDKGINN